MAGDPIWDAWIVGGRRTEPVGGGCGAVPILGRVRIVITGAAGMLGSKLAARLLDRGRLGEETLSEVLLVDAVAPQHRRGR